MKFNLNRSNWFSRVLVGTTLLATLGIMLPDAAQGNSAESNIASDNRIIEGLLRNIEQIQERLLTDPGIFCGERNGGRCIFIGSELRSTAVLFEDMGEALTWKNDQPQAEIQHERAVTTENHANRFSDSRLDPPGSTQVGFNPTGQDSVVSLTDYQQEQKAKLQDEATTLLQQGNYFFAYRAIGQVSEVAKTFDCRQTNGQWETIINRDSQTYPLILWSDLKDYSTEARCNAVSARLNNLERSVVKDVAQTFKVDEIEVDRKKITVVCVPNRGRCNSENIIFTLTRASRPSNWQIQEQFIDLVNNPGSESPIRN
ncbi:COP23 domain-containing protein [Roseofilum sp. Guam]|uniref:COP23 domain-containing protein n=1 Tax=Roseofilum sp. Guam TaxID=2821502 RepID=UPI001B2C1D3C|nr:COP23 domain-containing protein [Roseofilum sp. Guam]MBP0030845.1 hypothetical protein [Roseofilum sp. Guam]